MIFTLNRPGWAPTPEYLLNSCDQIQGGSHLAITAPAVVTPGNPGADQIRIYSASDDGHVVFTGHPNRDGFLAKVEVAALPASDFGDAERKAYRALAPSLSNLAAQLDIPLRVFQVDIVEERTGTRSLRMVTPYPPTPLAMSGEGVLTPALRGLLSVYREALNTDSAVYQYLCFFKIIEAIRKLRAQAASATAAEGGRPPGVPGERIPADESSFVPWLRSIFPNSRGWNDLELNSVFQSEARGKKFGDVIQHHLRPLRDDIAHALLSDAGELGLSADELVHSQRVTKWLPLTKCIVRRMLKNDFPQQFLPWIKEDSDRIG